VNLLAAKNADLERHDGMRKSVKADIDAATASCDAAIARVQQARQDAVAGYEVKLQALPAGVEASVRAGVAKALSQAEEGVQAVKGEIAQLQAKQAQVYERVGRAEAGVAELGPLSHIAEKLGHEIEAWELASQALGRDGLVAFSIDDAGPGIAAIANDLLTVCYGGKFSVRFETQRELRSGALREGFEIMVLDADDGKEKPVHKLSGGQCVYVNDCLMRAVSLYLAGASRFRTDTLFSDETDGLLDEEKKRQLILLKRRVLELGKYSREYFVTQTKEIQGLADYVINVADL
jgi:exonuclease SbcC